METFKLEHEFISFTNRVKFYILLFVGVISMYALIGFLDKQTDNILILVLVMGFLVGILIANKIFRSRFYLMDFYSDSNVTKIRYIKYSEIIEFETENKNIEAAIINTSSRSSFSFKIALEVENLFFEIEKDFDWSFEEMKNLFLHVKQSSSIRLTEKDKILLQRIDDHLLKFPF